MLNDRFHVQLQHDTLLDRTHQWWKLRVATFGFLVSAIIQFGPRLWYQVVSERNLALFNVISAFLAASSLILLFWGIRCPRCGSKWAMLAARQPSGHWLRWLRALHRCPQCGSHG
jgi:hypothetical protein